MTARLLPASFKPHIPPVLLCPLPAARWKLSTLAGHLSFLGGMKRGFIFTGHGNLLPPQLQKGAQACAGAYLISMYPDSSSCYSSCTLSGILTSCGALSMYPVLHFTLHPLHCCLRARACVCTCACMCVGEEGYRSGGLGKIKQPCI